MLVMAKPPFSSRSMRNQLLAADSVLPRLDLIRAESL
jgi:hypothetical protein